MEIEHFLHLFALPPFFFSAVLGAIIGPLAFRFKLFFPVLAFFILTTLFHYCLARFWSAAGTYDLAHIIQSGMVLKGIMIANYGALLFIGWLSQLARKHAQGDTFK